LTLLYVPALYLIVADLTNVFVGRRTENRERKTVVGGQRSEVGKQMSED
jgi:hypothetical protein